MTSPSINDAIEVVDTHIHLCYGPTFSWESNGWLASESESFQREWSEADLISAASASTSTSLTAGVFVECGNAPPLAEARWALAMASSSTSLIGGVTAHIPCMSGGDAVAAFLDALRDADGALPAGLKGGRQVLLGDPMPAPDACRAPLLLEGLAVLAANGLLWEWCCKPEALPHIAAISAQFPTMTFVLDHLGHNSGGNDLEAWKASIDLVAACPNVVAKMGACEEWAVDDCGPYLEHALRSFGFDRCLAEGNWFVNAAMGDAYDASFNKLLAACAAVGASDAEVASVFAGNARRVYSL
jgi:L-fuconolactonase|tara:strand:- start:1189 stop:2088 length:900 start_codon:yes stop_codon:yes gene_type:complete